MQTARLGILLLACFLLAACGGASEKSSSSANSNANTAATTAATTAPAKHQANACSLLTKADVEAFLGKKVKVVEEDADLTRRLTDMNSANCDYKVPGEFDVAGLEIFYGKGSEMDSSMMKDQINDGSMKPVAGVGDKAFREDRPDGRLHVRYRDDFIVINLSVSNMDEAANLEAEKALAKKVIARL